MGTNQLGGGQVTNGEHPLCPNTPELIQRNLSTLKYHLRKMADCEEGPTRNAWKNEAARLIREHNRLVRENRRILNSL